MVTVLHNGLVRCKRSAAERRGARRSGVDNLAALQELTEQKKLADPTFRAAPPLPAALHGAIAWGPVAQTMVCDPDTARMRIRVAFKTLALLAITCPSAVGELALAAVRLAEERQSQAEAFRLAMKTGRFHFPEPHP